MVRGGSNLNSELRLVRRDSTHNQLIRAILLLYHVQPMATPNFDGARHSAYTHKEAVNMAQYKAQGKTNAEENAQ
jgi:hypothetical protein